MSLNSYVEKKRKIVLKRQKKKIKIRVSGFFGSESDSDFHYLKNRVFGIRF